MTDEPTERSRLDRTNSDPTTLTRRACLSTLAAGGVALAGCASFDAGKGDSPTGGSELTIPEFIVDEDAQPTPMVLDAITVPEPGSVAFLDEFDITVAVANVGGATLTSQSVEFDIEYQDGANSASPEPINGPDPVAVSLPELDSGEWDTVEATLRVNAEGDWRLVTDASIHPSFDHQFDVQPKRLAPGESVASEVGHFEITALEPRYEHALHYETEEGGVGLFNQEATGLVSAGNGEVLVVHRFTVECTSDDRSFGFGAVGADNRFVNAAVTADPGTVTTREDMRDALDTLVLPVGDDPFGNNEVGPGETSELVAVQSVPVENRGDASVTLSFWGGTDDILFESPQEPPALPRFKLVAGTTNDGEDGATVLEMTVENVGDAVGTFRGAGQFYSNRPTASDWVYLPEGAEASLEPGARETLQIVASRGDGEYRVLPFRAELEL